MNIQIEYAEWDSDFFHQKTGIIKIPTNVLVTTNMLSEIKEMADIQNYQIIYIMLLHGNTIENNLLKISNKYISWVDTKIIYTKTIHPSGMSPHSFIESFNSMAIPDELYSITIESGKYSRFKNDPHFPKGAFNLLYKRWIERSVNKEIADDVLVHYNRSKINGFLSYKTDGTSCTIGLIAVTPDQQGRGIGSKLINHLEHKMLSQNINILNVATQSANIQACTFYEKIGFQIKDVTNIYHLWL
ncbi:GNAT family N-acetyltransferase [Bacteroides salyersiae]|uniref:GNAT family N-acetyltransferase n=1 Tax=Bacteroides salyersiae TaxID=291644 RepID=UPI001C39022B|nr:GNAT family N-acetyltransferase [Bacteroides salyersiae]MBV4203421.1 GNAT family N-acetyltransferase [Bacteroides salyersiae]MCB6648613.1 GNAT family N-acetyltransferase [Bacteroides salyersiae]